MVGKWAWKLVLGTAILVKKLGVKHRLENEEVGVGGLKTHRCVELVCPKLKLDPNPPSPKP